MAKVKKTKPATGSEYATHAGYVALGVVEDYLKRCGGLSSGFAWQRHEERLWREIRKAVRQAHRDGYRAGRAASKP